MGSQSVVVTVRAMGVSSSTSVSAASSARSSSSAKSGSLYAVATKFSSGVTSSSSAVSRNLCANCMSWLGAPPCITVFSKWKKLFICATVLLWQSLLVECVLPPSMNWSTREHGSWQEGWSPTLPPILTCRKIQSEPGTPFASVQRFERRETLPRKVHPRNLSGS